MATATLQRQPCISCEGMSQGRAECSRCRSRARHTHRRPCISCSGKTQGNDQCSRCRQRLLHKRRQPCISCGSRTQRESQCAQCRRRHPRKLCQCGKRIYKGGDWRCVECKHKQALWPLADAGYTDTEIARRMNLSRERIRQLLGGYRRYRPVGRMLGASVQMTVRPETLEALRQESIRLGQNGRFIGRVIDIIVRDWQRQRDGKDA